MRGFLKKLYYQFLTRKCAKNEPWLSYYSKENRSIKFTTKTIYEYMRTSVGNSLELYALNYFGMRITYGEMFRNIRNTSRSLKYLGVKKGDVVTICMPNTPEAVIMFYAINNIGAIADMVHPLSAPNEIKFYLQESKSRILMLYDANYERYKSILGETNVYKTILTSVKESMPLNFAIFYQLFKGIKIKKAPLRDRDFISWREFASYSQLYRKPLDNGGMNSKDTALILHSGGTTGIPKGIKISNFSFNAEVQQAGIVVEQLKPKDKVMAILPIFHGFGLGAIICCPLSLKVEVILIPEFDNKQFPKIMKDYKPNVLAGVPTLWEAMLTNDNFDSVDLSSLKYVISGGDHLTVALERKMNKFLQSHGANIVISKGYGMTESVAATSYTFEGANEPGSIGIPMVGNYFCICKPDSTEVMPHDTEGEICVNGPTIMQGYLNNPKETAKVLKKHKDGKIWLHTGDAGYISKKGIIYFTQRLKRVIVSSGFNVYPSVIEEVIEKHTKVKSACVIGIPHPYKMQVPKAYIVLEDGYTPNIKLEAEIRILCKKNLAVYSLPKEVEFRKTLPKTLYNKIDYKVLEQENIKNVKEQENI